MIKDEVLLLMLFCVRVLTAKRTCGRQRAQTTDRRVTQEVQCSKKTQGAPFLHLPFIAYNIAVGFLFLSFC